MRSYPLRLSLLLSAGLLLVLALSLMVGSSAMAQEPPPGFDPDLVPLPQGRPLARVGEPIYLQNCATCHGETGLGDGPTAADLPGPPAAFADPQAMWARSPGELFYTTKFGRIEKLMPPWQNRLTDEQIWQVVFYAWSLRTSPEEVETGRLLYEQSCAVCHGPNGAGDGPEAQDPMPDFTDPAQTLLVSQADWLAGWEAAHPDVGADWTEEQRRQVLEYIRTFAYAPPWESPFQPGDGTIQGVVTMGTPGLELPATLTATLDVFLGFEAVTTLTTTVAADGTFVFQGLDPNPDLVYMASVLYEGISYASEFLTLTPEAPTAEAQVTLYATTDDPADVFIARAHWIIDNRPGVLAVAVLYTFGNQGDRTLVGRSVEGVDVPVTVAIQVPPDAQEIFFQNGRMGDRFRRVGDRIYDTAPVIPGEATRQIVVQYTIPYPDTRYTLVQRFLYPVRSINLLIPALARLQAQVDALQPQPDQVIQDQTFRLWQGNDLPADATVEVRLSGLLEPGAVDPQMAGGVARPGSRGLGFLDPQRPWLYTLLVAVVLLGGLAWAWSQGLLGGRLSSEELHRQREALLDQIARLDDLHALGELEEDEWRRRREPLKRRLLLVSQQLERRPSEGPSS